MAEIKGIVRFIKTDSPEDDYFALESMEVPDHFTGDVHGPRGWVEGLIGKTVVVVETQRLYSVTVLD